MDVTQREPRILLDPTAERHAAERARLARPQSLEGLTVALLDISKPRGDLFLDRLEARLQERGVATKRFTKPAPLDLRQQIAESCDAVIEALAD